MAAVLALSATPISIAIFWRGAVRPGIWLTLVYDSVLKLSALDSNFVIVSGAVAGAKDAGWSISPSCFRKETREMVAEEPGWALSDAAALV